jgi:hypothetical protein
LNESMKLVDRSVGAEVAEAGLEAGSPGAGVALVTGGLDSSSQAMGPVARMSSRRGARALKRPVSFRISMKCSIGWILYDERVDVGRNFFEKRHLVGGVGASEGVDFVGVGVGGDLATGGVIGPGGVGASGVFGQAQGCRSLAGADGERRYFAEVGPQMMAGGGGEADIARPVGVLGELARDAGGVAVGVVAAVLMGVILDGAAEGAKAPDEELLAKLRGAGGAAAHSGGDNSADGSQNDDHDGKFHEGEQAVVERGASGWHWELSRSGRWRT